MVTTATAAVFCVFTACAAIGTADTFAAFFLLAPDIKPRKTDYGGDYCDKNKVFHKTVPFCEIIFRSLRKDKILRKSLQERS